MITKNCKKCKTEYPATREFFHGNNSTRDRLLSICKDCQNKERREYYKKHPEVQAKAGKKWYMKNKERSKNININCCLKKINSSLEDYKNRLKSQNGKCLICGINIIDYGKNFSVDHDHKTGKVRGLLCNNCNLVLGNAKDNPLTLIKAVKYLKK